MGTRTGTISKSTVHLSNENERMNRWFCCLTGTGKTKHFVFTKRTRTKQKSKRAKKQTEKISIHLMKKYVGYRICAIEYSCLSSCTLHGENVKIYYALQSKNTVLFPIWKLKFKNENSRAEKMRFAKLTLRGLMSVKCQKQYSKQNGAILKWLRLWLRMT
jgi:hypothetical protein